MGAFNLLLSLQDGREGAYWADAGTQMQLRRFDCMGLAAGLVLNLLDAAYEGSHGGLGSGGRTKRRAMVAFAGLLQLMQLAWLILKPQSYMRHRVSITFIQRLRWWSAFVGMRQGAAAVPIYAIIPFQRPLQPGSFWAFFTIACVVPL
jgi:hypothetical protein